MAVNNGQAIDRFGIKFQSFNCAMCGKSGGYYAGDSVTFHVFCSEFCLDYFCGRL